MQIANKDVTSQCTKWEQVGPARLRCTNSSSQPAPQYPFYDEISHAFQDHLLDLPTEEYNAFLFFPYSMTPNNQKRVWFGVNGSAYHSLPITVNLWNNWIFNDIIADDVSDNEKERPLIIAHMHPLPVTTRQDLVSGQLSGFSAALYLVIAFSFIPAGAIYFMVNEKTNLTKHQQLVSGISFIAYWVSIETTPALLTVSQSCEQSCEPNVPSTSYQTKAANIDLSIPSPVYHKEQQRLTNTSFTSTSYQT